MNELGLCEFVEKMRGTDQMGREVWRAGGIRTGMGEGGWQRCWHSTHRIAFRAQRRPAPQSLAVENL